MKRLDHGSDLTVLKNKASRFLPNLDDDIHHGPGQIIGPNDLMLFARAKGQSLSHALTNLSATPFMQ